MRRSLSTGKNSRGSVKTDYSRYRFTAKERVQVLLIGGLLGAFSVWICYHSVFAAPAGVLILLFYVRRKRKQKAAERRRLLAAHFKELLASIHVSMEAGYSLENSLRSAAADMERLYGGSDVICTEVREMIRRMDYQEPVEVLFADLGRRSGVSDIRYFGELLLIAKRTGGNMRRILEVSWRNLCGKQDTEAEIAAVTASRRLELLLMSLMPAGILLYMRLTFPDLLGKLYGNAAGALVMTACLALYIAAYVFGRHLTGSGRRI